MIEYVISGGPVMIPIGLASVVALAVFLERLWSLRRARVLPHALLMEVMEQLRQGRHDDALVRCRSADVAVARVLEQALICRDKPRERVRERLEEIGRREAAELERYIPVLGTIASISPLLGLLGTVGGMILTFQIIQEQGLGNVGNLAGGISQALVTTFAGLSVGIPAVVGNRYLLAKVDALLLDLEEASLGALDLLYGEQREEP
ncbi:MAG: MotA/TolQ/ExbB proton channel family protein [Deltaproteobacteria bacterium]|nr:MotA/TolQ/ExbB proton channel family protein [Deltaproteobacteria bacterium]